MTASLPPSVATIPDAVRWRAELTPAADGVYVLGGDAWRPLTWSGYLRLVSGAAAGLRERGLGRGDILAIVAPTALEWDLLDKAALLLGAAVVGIDPELPPARVSALLQASGATWLGTTGRGPTEPSTLIRTPGIRGAVVFGDSPPPDGDSRWVPWQRLLAAASDGPGDFEAVSPDDPAAIIWTSGTTGEPRAVRYSHRQVLLACSAILDAMPPLGGDRSFCWLPLSSLFQRIVNLCFLVTGSPTYFLEDPRRLAEQLPRVRPTMLIGVPRVFELIQRGLVERCRQLPRGQRRLAEWALRTADLAARERREKGRVPRAARPGWWLADRLVLVRLRQALGGRMRYMVTGTAPCPVHVLEFFDALGVPLLEAYGLTENVVPVAMNRLRDYRLGSVGRPLAVNEIELSSEGEILVRGPGVFEGYLGAGNRCEGLTRDGFYASGDLGFLDPDGYLHLTGRRKDVVKTASGRQISLTQVEAVLRQIPLVDQVVVCGDGRGPLVALVHLDEVRLGPAQAEDGTPVASPSTIADVVAREVEAVAPSLASHERVRGLLLLREPLSVEADELTPSFKVRRGVIEERYGGRIEALQSRIDADGRARLPLVEWL